MVSIEALLSKIDNKRHSDWQAKMNKTSRANAVKTSKERCKVILNTSLQRGIVSKIKLHKPSSY